MAERKGIGVHHQRRAGTFARVRRKAFQIAGETVAAVFHEHETAVHARNFSKAQRRKEFCAVDFGIQKQVRVAAFKLRLNQMRDDHGHQPFAAVRAVHGETAQRVFKQRACGDHLSVVIINGGGIG